VREREKSHLYNLLPQFKRHYAKREKKKPPTYLSLSPSNESISMFVCVCVCVCVRERERERDKHTSPSGSKNAVLWEKVPFLRNAKNEQFFLFLFFSRKNRLFPELGTVLAFPAVYGLPTRTGNPSSRWRLCTAG
jgi:hypothetical protein